MIFFDFRETHQTPTWDERADSFNAWLSSGVRRIVIKVGGAGLAIAGVVGLFYEFAERERAREEERVNRINVAWSQIAAAQSATGATGLRNAIETLVELDQSLEMAVFRQNESEDIYYARNLRNLHVPNGNFQAADFRGANLEGSDFTNADLRFADFSKTNLLNAKFDGALIGGADFRYAKGFAPDKSFIIDENYANIYDADYGNEVGLFDPLFARRFLFDSPTVEILPCFADRLQFVKYYVFKDVAPSDADVCAYHDTRRAAR